MQSASQNEILVKAARRNVYISTEIGALKLENKWLIVEWWTEQTNTAKRFAANSQIHTSMCTSTIYIVHKRFVYIYIRKSSAQWINIVFSSFYFFQIDIDIAGRINSRSLQRVIISRFMPVVANVILGLFTVHHLPHRFLPASSNSHVGLTVVFVDYATSVVCVWKLVRRSSAEWSTRSARTCFLI